MKVKKYFVSVLLGIATFLITAFISSFLIANETVSEKSIETLSFFSFFCGGLVTSFISFCKNGKLPDVILSLALYFTLPIAAGFCMPGGCFSFSAFLYSILSTILAAAVSCTIVAFKRR